MNITVIGTGYLGATHAVGMAELGHRVIGVDVDPRRVADLAAGRLPFHEPGLGEMLARHTASGQLRFTTSYEEAGAFGEVHFIGVGTPQRADSPAADMSYVEEAVRSIAAAATRDCVIAGKSTVPVGSARRLRDLARDQAREGVSVDLVWNPEFLREGFAVQDTLSPDRMVIGTDSSASEQVMREVYAHQLAAQIPLVVTDFETAELVKTAANAFLATKISFINALAEITEVAGGDIRTLADALGMDERIGRRFLNAGLGFGGGCLPKDIRALQARAEELGAGQSLGFLDQVDRINRRRRDRVVEVVHAHLGDRPDRENVRVAVLGAAFKPDSDDVRDSPALEVAARLHAGGYQVVVHDPAAVANAARLHPQLAFAATAEEALVGASAALLLTEWQQFRGLDPQAVAALMDEAVVYDGRNVLDPSTWEAAGFVYYAAGRRADSVEETAGGAVGALPRHGQHRELPEHEDQVRHAC